MPVVGIGGASSHESTPATTPPAIQPSIIASSASTSGRPRPSGGLGATSLWTRSPTSA
jgi:hypothetical protein